MPRNAAGIVSIDEFKHEPAFISGKPAPSVEPSPLEKTLKLLVSLGNRPNGLPGTTEELALYRELSGRTRPARPFNEQHGLNLKFATS